LLTDGSYFSNLFFFDFFFFLPVSWKLSGGSSSFSSPWSSLEAKEAFGFSSLSSSIRISSVVS
jgi:hypothetical protein